MKNSFLHLERLADEKQATVSDQDGIKLAKLYVKIWKFRLEHCWRMLQKLMVAATAVSAVPYVMEQGKAFKFGPMLYAFPVLGGLIALTATWIFAAEYNRLRRVSATLTGLLMEKLKLVEIETCWLLAARIGWVTVSLLAATSIILPVLNCIALFRVVLKP